MPLTVYVNQEIVDTFDRKTGEVTGQKIIDKPILPKDEGRIEYFLKGGESSGGISHIIECEHYTMICHGIKSYRLVNESFDEVLEYFTNLYN